MSKNKQVRIDIFGDNNIIEIYVDDTKECVVCKEEFPLTKEYWYVKNNNKTGFQSNCKLCFKEYSKSEKGKKTNKKYHKSDKGKETQKKYNKSEKRKDAHKKYYKTEKGLYALKKTYLKKFNMTPEDRDNMIIEQKNRCKICGCLLDQRKIESDYFYNKKIRSPIDHNHKTGKVRGILCNNCNILIGLSKDNPYVLINAIRYLENKDLNENFYYTL